MNWNPWEEKTEVWEPRGGWNPAFSEQEKIKCLHLFFFFRDRKGIAVSQAEVLANMYIWKRKNPSMKYTEDQEKRLKEALKPIIHSVKA
jgi:hypothetical protein